jgi:hypothetical protein
MLASTKIRALRPGAQRFELGGCPLKFRNDLAIAMPDQRQIVVRCLAAAIKTAAPRFVLGLDTLVVKLDPIQAPPELLVEPIRQGLFGCNHSLTPSRDHPCDGYATSPLLQLHCSARLAAISLYFAGIESGRDALA